VKIVEAGTRMWMDFGGMRTLQIILFVTGEGFDYLGRHYRLQPTDDRPDAGVKLDRGRLRMPRPTAEAGAGAGAGTGAMIRWYRQRARAWLPRRIRPWAQHMDLCPGDLDVRDLGYRWGSLGKNHRFNIHWAAMQLPVSLLDYVIVHELAHIGQPRHTPAFWATVQRALPNHDQRTRLATVGTTLWLG
jgi:predicted metal-dependent hydrolase